MYKLLSLGLLSSVVILWQMTGTLPSLAENQADNNPQHLFLKEGQKADVPATDLTVEVKAVSDLTSRGCLGGPIGCPDHVRLVVTKGEDTKEITLYAPRARFQRDQHVNQVRIFGYKLKLMGLEGKEVVLSIEKQ